MEESKAALLKSFVSELPPGTAAALTVALERSRLEKGPALPHDLVLQGLRPALQQGRFRASRTPTPLRLFCQPFEDLLFPAHNGPKLRGRIARTSIMPVWDWLRSDIMPDNLSALCDGVGKAILADDSRQIRRSMLQIHGVCGLALSSILDGLAPGSPEYERLATRLGGPECLEDARDMAMVLEIADDIQALLEGLPRPIERLSDDQIALARRTYEVIADHMPDHAPYVVFVTMGRLSRPWEILKLIGRITKKDDDSLAAVTDLNQCAALLFADLQTAANFFTALDPAQSAIEDIVHQLTFFAELSHGLTNHMGIRKDGEWGKVIADTRTVVASKMEVVINRAIKALRASIPTKQGDPKAPLPDFSIAPDPERHAKAVHMAKLIREIRYLAEPGAFSGTYAALVPPQIKALQLYADKVTEALKTPDAQGNAAVNAHAVLAKDLSALLLNEDEADVAARRMEAARSDGVAE